MKPAAKARDRCDLKAYDSRTRDLFHGAAKDALAWTAKPSCVARLLAGIGAAARMCSMSIRPPAVHSGVSSLVRGSVAMSTQAIASSTECWLRMTHAFEHCSVCPRCSATTLPRRTKTDISAIARGMRGMVMTLPSAQTPSLRCRLSGDPAIGPDMWLRPAPWQKHLLARACEAAGRSASRAARGRARFQRLGAPCSTRHFILDPCRVDQRQPRREQWIAYWFGRSIPSGQYTGPDGNNVSQSVMPPAERARGRTRRNQRRPW